MTVMFIFLFAGTSAPAQSLKTDRRPDVKNGEAVYKGGCIACHGDHGSGAPMTSTMFKRSDTFPDFAQCSGTTPEPNSTWKAIIVHGGKGRAVSKVMPAFEDLLTSQQMDDVIAYMRGFCTNSKWPPGELNLPRAIVTEKAFPEDEVVMSTEMNATGPLSAITHVIHEQRIGMRNQIEVDVPFNFSADDHGVTVGVIGLGDISLGLKHVMFSNLSTGSILALQTGVIIPTGNSYNGTGSGTTTFEEFAAYDKLFRTNTFIQSQAGADIPISTTNTPRRMFWQAAIGQALPEDRGLGRMWTPMVEILGQRDFTKNAGTNWDVLPQIQVTLSRRQHIRADVGVRTPFTNTLDRRPQVVFYVLWDRADGKLWGGWR